MQRRTASGHLGATSRARRDDQREGGFTLIELLIVIVVLGVLAAVVIFALGGVTSRSAASACKSDATNVETAIGAYNVQNSAAQISAAGSESTAEGDLVPTYLHSWPSSSHYVIALGSGATGWTAAPNNGVYVAPLSATGATGTYGLYDSNHCSTIS